MKNITVNHHQLEKLEDQELVRLYKQSGVQKAFEILLNRHKGKVYSYIYSMVSNVEVANDIFQETFTKVVSKLDETYSEQGKWIAWVMRIAHNATIDHIRKNKRFVDVEDHDEFSTSFYDRLPDVDQLDANEQMEFNESKSSLMKHIAKLPDEQRQVVIMRTYYELSFKEIADITQVSINTALGRMRYALINLRKMFEEEKEHEFRHATAKR